MNHHPDLENYHQHDHQQDHRVGNRSIHHRIVQTIWRHLCYGVSTVLAIGYTPFMPGTIASACALLICLVPFDIRFVTLWIGIVIASILGAICIPLVEQEQGDDASIIVIDEVVGMWITIASPLVPHTYVWIIVGFILFRYFDIIKPSVIARLNRNKGAVYVLADDILAGVCAAVCLHILYAGFLSVATLWYMMPNP